MKKSTLNNLDRLISKAINETLEGKANKIADEINELGGMDDGHPKFGKLNLSKMTQRDINKMMGSKIESDDDMDIDYEEDDMDYESDWNQLEEGETCEQCGKAMAMEGEMYEEGETCECGGTKQNLYKMTKFNPAGSPFDYVAEEDDIDFEEEEDETEDETEVENEDACKYHKKHFGLEDKRTQKFCGSNKMGLDKFKFSMNEKLQGGQRKLDKNHNGKIDAEDFKMLRRKKGGSEIDEKLHGGQRKLDKNHNGKIDSEDFKMLRKEGDEKFTQKVTSKIGNKKSVKLSESEMIDLIEKIVKEEKVKSNIKVGVPRGLEKYNQVHAKDGKENNEALKATAKKMKEYLKDGSKGPYETNPDFFPKGNGELAKMDKKAYIPSGAVEEYTDNFTAAALENLDYDEIKPNEEWVSANVEGSSKTGNNPDWANTGKSDVNKKRNKIRKDNLLAKIKRKAYNKSPQPVVNDNAGENEGDKIMSKLGESVEPKKVKMINEEFERMKNLMGYNQKTQ
jgi:hypothetical protein